MPFWYDLPVYIIKKIIKSIEKLPLGTETNSDSGRNKSFSSSSVRVLNNNKGDYDKTTID